MDGLKKKGGRESKKRERRERKKKRDKRSDVLQGIKKRGKRKAEIKCNWKWEIIEKGVKT